MHERSIARAHGAARCLRLSRLSGLLSVSVHWVPGGVEAEHVAAMHAVGCELALAGLWFRSAILGVAAALKQQHVVPCVRLDGLAGRLQRE